MDEESPGDIFYINRDCKLQKRCDCYRNWSRIYIYQQFTFVH